MNRLVYSGEQLPALQCFRRNICYKMDFSESKNIISAGWQKLLKYVNSQEFVYSPTSLKELWGEVNVKQKLEHSTHPASAAEISYFLLYHDPNLLYTHGLNLVDIKNHFVIIETGFLR